MVTDRATRGHGLIEGFLARQRARMADKLIPSAHRDGQILDIGHGAFPLFLSQTQARGRHGVDRISEEAAVEWAKRGIHLVYQDLERDWHLPYSDAYFSAVTMLAVFEHIAPHRLVELLTEVRRVLQPGGVYVMTTPAAWTGWLLALMARLRLVSHDEIDEHKGSYGRQEIQAILEAAGFRPDKVRTGYFEAFANNWAVASS